MSSQRTNIIKLIIHCSSFAEAPDDTLTTVYWETHHSSVALKRRMKSSPIDSPSSPKPINDNHFSPLFIMIQTPPLTKTVISSSSVGDVSCVALKCVFHHITLRLAAGDRHKWQMNTRFRYHPRSVLSLSLFMPSQNHFHSRFRSQSITWLKNASGGTQLCNYYTAS